MTAWADIPLTDDIRAAVAHEFGVDTDGEDDRLYGGEESASYRIGDNVIRIGQEWRRDDELEWCHGVARAAVVSVPEAVSPLTSNEGRTVVRVEGQPVSVWPFAEGSWANRDDAGHRAQAAELLARVHRGLARVPMAARPVDTSPLAPTPDLQDWELDQWWRAFVRPGGRQQALHGDFYRGNVLVNNGRFNGLLDWDNAFVGRPAQELAWASWEWTQASDDFDLAWCSDFVSAYVAAGGTARGVDERMIAQVVRQRIRWEVAYGRAMRARGVEHDEDDLEYEADLIEAFQELRAEYI